MIDQIGFGELVILGAGLFVYLIPSLVAYRKEIDAKAAVILANVLLGWTFIAGPCAWYGQSPRRLRGRKVERPPNRRRSKRA